MNFDRDFIQFADFMGSMVSLSVLIFQIQGTQYIYVFHLKIALRQKWNTIFQVTK